MKKIFLLSLFLAASCLAALADLPFRNHRYDAFKVLRTNSGQTVFIGNSITNMHNWAEALGNTSVVNRGVSGAVTGEWVENLEGVLAGQPARIFLMLGTNDLGTAGINTAAHVAQNARFIVNRIRYESPRTAIYVQSILPSSLRNESLLKQSNDSLKKICQETGATYIDLWDKLAGVANNQNTLDGLHLCATGYRIWCNAILPYLGDDFACTYPADATNQYGGQSGSLGMRVSYFGMSQIEATDYLFLGDEMVHGMEWSELLHTPTVLNRGNGWGYPGLGITNMTAEVPVILKGRTDNAEPAGIIVYAGAQEANSTTAIATIKTQYSALLAAIRKDAPNAKLLLLSALPVTATQTNSSRIVQLNAEIQALANADGNATYVDLYGAMQTNHVQTAEYFIGGNYVSGIGYAKISELLAPHIPGAKATTVEEARTIYKETTARNTIGKILYAIQSLSIGDGMGQYSADHTEDLINEAEKANTMLGTEGVYATEIEGEAEILQAFYDALIQKINLPEADTWYTLYTPQRGNRVLTSTGAGNGATGGTDKQTAQAAWKFADRGDGSYDIINKGDGSYLSPTAAYNKAITTVSTRPAQGWELSYADLPGTYIIRCGNVQLNQTPELLGNAIYNWSTNQDGLDRTDAGCVYRIELAPSVEDALPVTPTTVTEGAFADSTRWYTLQVGTQEYVLATPQAAGGTLAPNRSVTWLDDADLWCFEGDNKTGFLIYNRKQGASHVLASSTPITATAQLHMRALLTDEDAAEQWHIEDADEGGSGAYVLSLTHHSLDGAKKYLAAGNGTFTLQDKAAGAESGVSISFAKGTQIVDLAAGSFVAGTSTFSKTWQSHATAPSLTMDAGANNMNATGTNINAYVGTRANPQPYTLTVPEGYLITDYRFDFKSCESGQSITVSGGGQSLNSTDENQTLSVENIDARTTSFSLSGANKAVTLSNFRVGIRRDISTTPPVGITLPTTGNEKESGAEVIYDLTGRKASRPLAPGIYIVNGKKVLVAPAR